MSVLCASVITIFEPAYILCPKSNSWIFPLADLTWCYGFQTVSPIPIFKTALVKKILMCLQAVYDQGEQGQRGPAGPATRVLPDGGRGEGAAKEKDRMVKVRVGRYGNS